MVIADVPSLALIVPVTTSVVAYKVPILATSTFASSVSSLGTSNVVAYNVSTFATVIFASGVVIFVAACAAPER